MKTVFSSLLLFISFASFSQIKTIKLDKLKSNDLSISDINITDNALILNKHININYLLGDDDNWYIKETISQRIQFLNPNAFSLELFSINYNSKTDSLSKVKANFYFLKNRKLKSSKIKPILKESKTDTTQKQLTFKHSSLEPGNILDLSYTRVYPSEIFTGFDIQDQFYIKNYSANIITPNLINYSTSIYEPPNSIIKKYTQELKIRIVPIRHFFEFKGKQGLQKIQYSRLYKTEGKGLFITCSDVAAKETSTKASNEQESDFYVTFNLENMRSIDNNMYNTVHSYHSNNFSNNTTKERINAIIEDIKKSCDANTKDELLLCTLNYVKSNFTWNSIHNIQDQKDVLSILIIKTGNSSELNHLIIKILQGLNLKANLVLLENEKKKQSHESSLKNYNYALTTVKILNKTYYIDPTKQQKDYTLIPYDLINRKGILIEDIEDFYNISLTPNTKSSIYTMANMKLENFKLKGNIKRRVSNYYINTNNKHYKPINLDAFDSITKNETTSKPQSQEQVLEVSTSLKTDSDNNIIINLNSLFFQEVLSKKFTSKKKSKPIDFEFPFEHKSIIQIEIPNTYDIKNLKPNERYNLPEGYGKLTTSYQFNNNVLNIVITISVNKSHMPSDLYPAFKTFFETYHDTLEEEIHLIAKQI
jgi:hypothetical protein